MRGGATFCFEAVVIAVGAAARPPFSAGYDDELAAPPELTLE